jgi:predicted PurR-regulated permease PerM
MQQIDGWFIGPVILGDSVGVSPFWIITAVTVGGAVMGVVGMFIGVPVVVLIKTISEETIAERLSEKGYETYELENIRVPEKIKLPFSSVFKKDKQAK